MTWISYNVYCAGCYLFSSTLGESIDEVHQGVRTFNVCSSLSEVMHAAGSAYIVGWDGVDMVVEDMSGN